MYTPLLLCLILYIGDYATSQHIPSDEWWKNALIYQVYPRSFKDSNNDGMGDLRGIISKLDHLKDINVDAVWLSPIYESPQYDFGYDISDYRAVDPQYGTMEDFEELVAKATELGMKVIMDLVPNHSSHLHEWFQESLNGSETYKDYYVWKDGKGDDGMEEPTNWLGIFGGKAWTYMEEREQFYLHQFTEYQPDLNYNNPKIIEEFNDIMRFWMDKGIYGFRVDAVDHMYERFEDEYPFNDCHDGELVWLDIYHNNTRLLDESFDIVYHWRKFIDEYSSEKADGEPRVIITESNPDIEDIWKSYSSENGTKGAHFPFNFRFVTQLDDTKDARDIVNMVQIWFAYMPPGAAPSWLLGNHDNHRVATKVGPKLATTMNMMIAVLPGVMITYNGEEIGMENGEITWEQGKDPQGCNAEQEDFDKISRDFERTPFHWDDSANAGFNEGADTWLPVSSKYTTNNLAQQKMEAETNPSKGNFYQNYKALTSLRRTSKALRDGTWEMYSIGKDGLLVIRKNPGEQTVVFVAHLAKSEKNFSVNFETYGFVPRNTEFKIISSNQEGFIGKTIDLPDNTITMEPYDGYVLLESSANREKVSLIILLFALLRYFL